jgi:hypothetical protein
MDFLQGGWDGGLEGDGAGWGGDLGMGVGWDGGAGDHEGLDLFDGFFFGGTGNF